MVTLSRKLFYAFAAAVERVTGRTRAVKRFVGGETVVKNCSHAFAILICLQFVRSP